MRIAIVIRDFNPHRGGAEHWTYQFVQSLVQAGHEVHVVAETAGSHADTASIVFHEVRSSQSHWQFAAAAEQTLKTLSVDVIHDMGQGWYCDVFQPHGGSRRASFEQNLLLCPAWSRPLKRGLARCLPRYREFGRLLKRQYVGDGRRYIALSRMVAGHMRRYHQVADGDLRLVYNGVDIERFTPDCRREHREPVRRRLHVGDETLILLVTHNYRLKGVPTLLRAMSRLRQQGQRVRLAIAGGKRPGPYVRMAQRLGVAQDVTFLGCESNVLPYYAAADLYVHPTFYDPCSLVVLEALACGLPVVTSRFNGAGELIRAGIEGHVIDDPADDRVLAECLRPLLDPTIREPMGQSARELAEQHPLQRNVREIVAVYEEIAGLRRQAA